MCVKRSGEEWVGTDLQSSWHLPIFERRSSCVDSPPLLELLESVDGCSVYRKKLQAMFQKACTVTHAMPGELSCISFSTHPAVLDRRLSKTLEKNGMACLRTCC